MLLYSMLFLTGYGLTMDDIQHFRQWGSRTPGHPEYGVVPGAEVTTGPLGQGVGNAVGLAIAEGWLAATFNRPGHEVMNHHTYVMASDGDMMEGVAAEAASIAGQFRLGQLIVPRRRRIRLPSKPAPQTFHLPRRCRRTVPGLWMACGAYRRDGYCRG